MSALLLALAGAGEPAWGWAQLGHALVGDLAAQQLTPAARRQVEALLAGETDPTLGGVASWADALRSTDPDRFRATSTWHYINARGGGCAFDEARDCKDGNCAVSAITAQEKILADPAQPREARRDALKFLVHFIGDIHQPLHAGNREDSGGNRYQVSLRTAIQPEDYARSSFRDGVMGTNLHAVWDYYVLASAGLERTAYRARLTSSALRTVARPGRATPMAWARESCKLIDSQKLYPPAHMLDEAYLAAWRPFAERRISVAAKRLAAVLNQALGTAR